MHPSTSVPNSNKTSTHNGCANSLINGIPYIDLEVNLPELIQDAKKVIKEVFPMWHKNDLKFVQCKDGITNQLVRVTGSKGSVLVRAYGKGSERFIDRKQEIINFLTLSRQDLAPPLFARFRNGLVYGFIEGRVSQVEDLRSPKMAKWIATRMAQWHKVELPGQTKEPILVKNLRSWFDQVPEKYIDPKTQATFQRHFNMKQLRAEMNALIEHIEKLGSPVVFSHNDLLYGNIIYNDDKEEAYFIDYEYGGYAYRGFDIGNHFNEHCGFECDYSKYPSKEFQLEWIKWYLQAGGETPSKDEINRLYDEANVFSLLSHYYWGLWGLIQAMVSDIDFDYMEYAVHRFSEYNRRKGSALAYLDV